MINDLKNKLVSFYLRHRKLVKIAGVVAFALLMVFIFLPRKEVPQQNNIPEPANNETNNGQDLRASEPPFTFNKNEAYFINQVITNIAPVTGFSWKENKLIYSTPTGIYKAGTNEPVITGDIADIRWSDNFNALVKTNGSWNKLDIENKSLSKITPALNSPKIDNRGNRIVDFQKNTITLYNTDSFSSENLSLSESVDNVFFISSSQDLVVSTTFGVKTYVYKISGGLETIKSFEFDGKFHLSSVSKEGESFVLIADNKLVTANFSGVISIDMFTKESTLSSIFSNSTSVVVVEKYKDTLGRLLDNIYLVNLGGSKILISDSKPIANRIDQKIPMSTNTNGSIVSFAENNKKSWILALKPNLFPTYSVDGELVFSNIKPTSH